MNNTSLVLLQNNQLVTTSEIIAQSIDVHHKNTLDLIKRYKRELEPLGSLAFETRVKRADNRGGEKTTYALLNEQQATFLISLSRNTSKVVEFKLALTKAFFEARNLLKQNAVEAKTEHKSYLKIFSQFCDEHNYSDEERTMFLWFKEQAIRQGYAIACAKFKEQEPERQLKDDEIAISKETAKQIFKILDFSAKHKREMMKVATEMREQASVLMLAAEGYEFTKSIVQQEMFNKL